MLCPCRSRKNLSGTKAATDCAPVPGYKLQADTNWYGTPGATLEGQLPTGTLAKAKCDADPQCTHWNNWGYWMNGPAKNYGPYEGLCIYSKPACDVYPGYEVKPNTNWYPVAGVSTQGKFDTGAEAKAKCDSDPGCTHWNNYGYTMNGPSEKYFPYNGLCIYKKTKCPEKPGYMLQTDTNWIGTPGVTKEGQFSTGDAAKDKCDKDPACTHWNNWGYWMNGPASRYIPYEGLCIYKKSGATGVTVYQEKNFGGAKVDVGIGEYNRCLKDVPGGNLPLKNDSLRSIKIPPGFKVTVGQHCKPGPGPSGIVRSYTEDVADLGDLDMQASYIKVESTV